MPAAPDKRPSYADQDIPRHQTPPEGQELEAIHIEPLGKGEGVLTHTNTKFKRGGQGGGPLYDTSTEKHHHPDLDHLSAHLKHHLSESFGTNAEGETDGPEHEPGTEVSGKGDY